MMINGAFEAIVATFVLLSSSSFVSFFLSLFMIVFSSILNGPFGKWQTSTLFSYKLRFCIDIENSVNCRCILFRFRLDIID